MHWLTVTPTNPKSLCHFITTSAKNSMIKGWSQVPPVYLQQCSTTNLCLYQSNPQYIQYNCLMTTDPQCPYKAWNTCNTCKIFLRMQLSDFAEPQINRSMKDKHKTTETFQVLDDLSRMTTKVYITY